MAYLFDEAAAEGAGRSRSKPVPEYVHDERGQIWTTRIGRLVHPAFSAEQQGRIRAANARQRYLDRLLHAHAIDEGRLLSRRARERRPEPLLLACIEGMVLPTNHKPVPPSCASSSSSGSGGETVSSFRYSASRFCSRARASRPDHATRCASAIIGIEPGGFHSEFVFFGPVILVDAKQSDANARSGTLFTEIARHALNDEIPRTRHVPRIACVNFRNSLPSSVGTRSWSSRPAIAQGAISSQGLKPQRS